MENYKIPGYDADTLDYTLSRSKRKTIAICISDGKIDVRAPLRTPVYKIEEFIALKKPWIQKHLKSSQNLVNKRNTFQLNYGDTIYFMDIPIKITGGDSRLGIFTENSLLIPSGLTPEQIKKECIKAYRTTAPDCFIPRAMEFAKNMHVKPQSIKINGAKSRWGSCSANRNINFSWRLLMADEDAIDYVIVHELTHLKEMNHSPRFWKLIEDMMPDYRDRKKRLKELNTRLQSQDWD